MYKLAVIVPKGSGGVLTVVNKVIRGLVNEKFDLQLFTMNSHRYVSYYINSFKMNLNNYDAVLYFGSITPLSSLLVRIPKALFIHGFVRHELFGILKSGHPKAKVGALIDLLRYESVSYTHLTLPTSDLV